MHPRAVASVALGGFAGQALALIANHILQPEYDPGVHFVSEYANGSYAWVGGVGAFCAAVGTLALLVGLRALALAPTRSAAFVLFVVNLATKPVLRLFPVNPMAPAVDGGGLPAFTPIGWIHALTGIVTAVSMLVAIGLVTVRLRRSSPDRRHAPLGLLAVLGPVFFVATLVTPAVTFPSGLLQRLFILCVWLWTVIVSLRMRAGSLVDPHPGAVGNT